MVNRFEDQEEQGPNIEKIIQEFSEDNPDVEFHILQGDTPEAREGIDMAYMANRPRHPEQIVAYESGEQGPFNYKQWPPERAFIQKAFEIGMFNKLLYQGPFGGAHTSISDKDELQCELDRIDEGFARNPDGDVSYFLGMNIEIQSYDSEKQRIITENKIKKFKGLK